MNGDYEELVSILCKENWGGMPQDVFQQKIGAAVTYLLQRSVRTYWIHAGILAVSGFMGGAAVWISLIMATGKNVLGG